MAQQSQERLVATHIPTKATNNTRVVEQTLITKRSLLISKVVKMSELLIAGQTNDEILQSLSYKLAPTSEYIQQRRMSRFYPSGASSYSSNTTQIARIELKGQGGFLDLSTLKIAYRLVNNSTTAPILLAGGPHSLVSRIRVFC